MKKLKPDAIISTFFGIGKIPFMPGTFGSYVGIILVAAIFYQPHMVEIEGKRYLDMGAVIISPNYIVHVLLLASLLLYALGVWASDKYSKRIGRDDPSAVVIDEVAGIFTASTLVALVYSFLLTFYEKDFILYLTAAFWFFPAIFILFRIFDILKPWHIGNADRKYHGGFGIMIDDQIAAVYTTIAFYLIFFALKSMGILDHFTEVGTLGQSNKIIMLSLLWPFYILLNPQIILKPAGEVLVKILTF
jgi:phosphatidylglycerophosphatase A